MLSHIFGGESRQRLRVLIPRLSLLVKGVDELLEDEWIDVLAKLIEQEPIPHAMSVADGLYLVPRCQSCPGLEEHYS